VLGVSLLCLCGWLECVLSLLFSPTFNAVLSSQLLPHHHLSHTQTSPSALSLHTSFLHTREVPLSSPLREYLHLDWVSAALSHTRCKECPCLNMI
jgi:hypothetical protein